jgi:hypothetical protein
VEERFIDLTALSACRMALSAVFLAEDDMLFMTLGHGSRAFKYIADQQLVLLYDGQVMAVMAVKLLVLALCPAVVCRLHQMAANAELRIILSKIVKLESNEPAPADNDQQQADDQQLRL